MRVKGSLLTAAAMLVAGALAAGTALAASLPSKPGRVFNTVHQLQPGQWLNLGPPAPDPKWGRARGRAWTSTMPYAPALGGAFLYGSGRHGWVDPKTGRYMDGLWLYDANANRWVNFYPGTDTRHEPALMVNRDGIESVKGGHPVPIARMVHGYEMTTWDPERQLFYAMPVPNGDYMQALPSTLNFFHRNAGRLNESALSPWIFDPWNRKWNRLKTVGPSPGSSYGDVAIYIPAIGQMFFYHKRQVSFYDPAANRWQTVTPAGPPPPFGIDPVACYDPQRDRVYLGGGSYPAAKGRNALWIYDIDKNRWIDPAPSGSPGDNSYGTNVAILDCDTAADRVVLIRHGGQFRGVHVYDPDRNAWSDRVLPLPASWKAGETASGFFHPLLGVHYVFVAGDSRDDGRMYVLRLPEQ